MRHISLVLSLVVLVLALVVPAHAAAPEEDPPVTIYDEQGNIIYSNEIMLQSEFLYKPFQEYTVVEGFLLLFLVVGFGVLIWHVVRGVF